MTDWKQVATVLLGTWPSQVASWGREAVAAYIGELDARGMNPEQAIAAIRLSVERFPPSAGELAAVAQHDPSMPTFAEAAELIFGQGGVLNARTQVSKTWWEAGERDRLDDEARLERAGELHPLVGAFVRVQGLNRLRRLQSQLDDPEYGEVRRKQLAAEWDEFCETNETRDIAALVAGRRGELVAFDPLRALPAGFGFAS